MIINAPNFLCTNNKAINIYNSNFTGIKNSLCWSSNKIWCRFYWQNKLYTLYIYWNDSIYGFTWTLKNIFNFNFLLIQLEQQFYLLILYKIKWRRVIFLQEYYHACMGVDLLKGISGTSGFPQSKSASTSINIFLYYSSY